MLHKLRAWSQCGHAYLCCVLVDQASDSFKRNKWEVCLAISGMQVLHFNQWCCFLHEANGTIGSICFRKEPCTLKKIYVYLVGTVSVLTFSTSIADTWALAVLAGSRCQADTASGGAAQIFDNGAGEMEVQGRLPLRLWTAQVYTTGSHSKCRCFAIGFFHGWALVLMVCVLHCVIWA